MQKFLIIILASVLNASILLPQIAHAWPLRHQHSAVHLDGIVEQAAPLHRVASEIESFLDTTATFGMQRALTQLGYYSGTIDGDFGSGTSSAMRNLMVAEGYRFPIDAGTAEEINLALLIVDHQKISFQAARQFVPALRQAADYQKAQLELRNAGRLEDAETLVRGASAQLSRLIGPQHPFTLQAQIFIGDILYAKTDLVQATAVLEAAYKATQPTGQPNSLSQNALRTLAQVYASAGKLQTAEAAYNTFFATQTAIGASIQSLDHLAALSNAAALRMQYHGFEGSELALRKIHGLASMAGGEIGQNFKALSEANLSVVLLESGRFGEAEKLVTSLIAQVSAGKEQFPRRLAMLHQTLARIKLAQDAPDEAIFHARKAVEIVVSKVPDSAFDHAHHLGGLARILIQTGAPAEAVALALEAKTKLAPLLESTAPERMLNTRLVADGYRAQGNLLSSLDEYDELIQLFPTYLNAQGVLSQQEVKESREMLTGYFGVMADINPPLPGASAKSIKAQGWWTYGSLDSTLTDLAARQSAGDPETRQLLRQFQETRDALTAARMEQAGVFTVSNPAASGAAQRVSALKKQHDALLARIRRQAPDVAEKIQPSAVALPQIQAALAGGEMAVAFASTKDHLYRWVVTRDSARWTHHEVTRADLQRRISALRQTTDVGARLPEGQPQGRCALPSPSSLLTERAFDLCAAWDLHDLVLSDIDWQGVSALILVPDGPLEGFPFSALVTNDPIKEDPQWLIDRVPVSVLPTLASLVSFRSVEPSTEAQSRQQFLGVAPGTFSSFAGAEVLRLQPPDLPGTLDEVQAIADLLPPGSSEILQGVSAQEAELKTRAFSGFEIVSFATHGLTAFEAEHWTGGRISEPALLLSGPSQNEDGILTASEVGKLDFKDVGLVLLSGCNTASASAAEGAEGLSGLARAFFFAGARSVLASHWSIEDQSSKRLMTEIVKSRSASLSPQTARATRGAMLKLKSIRGFEHPFFWAPFEFIGIDARTPADSTGVDTPATLDPSGSDTFGVSARPLGAVSATQVSLRGAIGETSDLTTAPLLISASAELEAALGLSQVRRRDIQRRLTLIAFDTNGVDGQFGEGTRRAIRQWQRMSNVAETGFLSGAQLALLETETADVWKVWGNQKQVSAPKKRTKRRKRARKSKSRARSETLSGIGGR